MEWTVVTVLVTIAGLGVTLVKPLLSLNTSITMLTAKIEQITTGISEMGERNTRAHDRLWEHNKEQDKEIADHEKRLITLEHND